MTHEPLRVLIADDHPVFRRGLRTTLHGDERFAVVGEAAPGTETIAAALDLQPDAVLMDLQRTQSAPADVSRGERLPLRLSSVRADEQLKKSQPLPGECPNVS
jgi:DNA-binding NarL/FixJ family response regulator